MKWLEYRCQVIFFTANRELLFRIFSIISEIIFSTYGVNLSLFENSCRERNHKSVRFRFRLMPINTKAVYLFVTMAMKIWIWSRFTPVMKFIWYKLFQRLEAERLFSAGILVSFAKRIKLTRNDITEILLKE